MKIIDDIKSAVDLEIRTSADAHEYFEAVFMSKDMEKLASILKENMGDPLKPAGKNVRFDRNIQKIVDIIGGLRREQSFYVKDEGADKYMYVALWPWQSDPSKTTLKIGICDMNKLGGK
ncbi:MAG: hypothetical protein Q8R48_06525 [Candidatus Omnitrophota bacterium]|nr:hypothetical protein [Candidatus Omnitrophota bacterium]